MTVKMSKDRDTEWITEYVQKNCAACGRTPNWRYQDKFTHEKTTITSHIRSGCPSTEVTFACLSCLEKEDEEKSKDFVNLGSLFTSEEEKI